MRRRALLLVLLVGGLACATGAALGTGVVSGHRTSGNATAFARADLPDVPALTALSRVRDLIGRDHEARRDLAAALGIALVLLLSGVWWLARERAAGVPRRRLGTTRHTRAPPLVAATVYS
jgi:hypothetical protein